MKIVVAGIESIGKNLVELFVRFGHEVVVIERSEKNLTHMDGSVRYVIGDICGVVSGSTGAVISIKLMQVFNTKSLLITLIVMGIISALTIGGKAIEKAIAMNKSNEILYRFSYIMSYFIKR